MSPEELRDHEFEILHRIFRVMGRGLDRNKAETLEDVEVLLSKLEAKVAFLAARVTALESTPRPVSAIMAEIEAEIDSLAKSRWREAI